MGDEVWKQSHWTANVDYVWPKRSLFWSFLDYPFMFFFVCVTPFDFHRSFISGVMWVKQRHKPAIWEWFISLYHLSIVIWGMVYGIVLPTWYLLTIDFIRIFLTYLWIFILVLPTLDFLQLNSSIFFRQAVAVPFSAPQLNGEALVEAQIGCSAKVGTLENHFGMWNFGCTLWLCQNSYWKWWFIVDFPIKNGDFP